MLIWIEKNNVHYGYNAEDKLVCVVEYENEECGWAWTNLVNTWGESCYDTADEAKADAEWDYNRWNEEHEQTGIEPELTDEELAEIYGDMLYHERKDMGAV